MKLKTTHNTIAAVVILLLILFYIVFITNSPSFFLSQKAAIIDLNDDWQIEVNGTSHDCHSLSEANTGVINESDVVILSHTLPDSFFSDACLSFFTSHALVDVYLDDAIIYSFGHDYYEQGLTVPKLYNNVSLGNDYQNKELKIILTGSQTASFSGIHSIFLGERGDIYSLRLQDYRVIISLGVFLFTLGIILIILSPFLFFYHDKDSRLFFSGLLSFLLGTYILSYFGIITILIGKATLNTIAEYASLYNIPTAISGYFISIFTGKRKRIMTYIFILNIFLFLSSIVLEFANIYKFTNFSLQLHFVALAESILSIILLIREFREKRQSTDKEIFLADEIFLVGLLIFMFLSIIDMIIYNYNKYFKSSGVSNSKLYGFSFGALIFVSSLMISYLYYNIYSKNFEYKQSQISNLAYTDPLTGLSNRARCEQIMEMLSQEKNNYSIINLDLNRLKQINDSLGHHEGDRLLTGFATILSDCFWNATLIGRMGGDEFIVIMTDDNAPGCTKKLHELYAIIDEWNRKEQAFQYSVSYGYAYSYEVPNASAKEVYMLADSRMYEMKKEHHALYEKEVMN